MPVTKAFEQTLPFTGVIVAFSKGVVAVQIVTRNVASVKRQPVCDFFARHQEWFRSLLDDTGCDVV